MISEARYAIYFAPSPDTPLWWFGSKVLGYDAASGEDQPGFTLPEYSNAKWHEMTAHPRTYGFHATLKAPFSLNKHSEKELRDALEKFCRTHLAFRLGPLSISAVGSAEKGFVAFTQTSQSQQLVDLEKAVVQEFDIFRRPLTEAERLKRHPETLSERQRMQLDKHGYPFIFEDFRFHMTLTGPVANAPMIADQLADALANRIGTVDINIDALCLFKQAAKRDRFVIIERFKLGS
jgi:2'-5' RNA ligase